jgi:microcin C transport system substrate-binding protein
MRLVRTAALFATLALASLSPHGSAAAQDQAPAVEPGATPPWRIGLSLLGEPKYTKPFDHYDYVNPDAPKGGTVRLAIPGTFDNFNIVLMSISGTQVKGVIESGVTNVYQTLMTDSQGEPSTEYGEIADAVRFPDDISSVTFRINPKARWNDGQPITPDDVVWSFEVGKANNVQTAAYYHDVAKAEVTAPDQVTFTFSTKGNRELPQIVGQLFVLPKHWWLANGPGGKPRDIANTSLEPPLGSGPYKLKSFEAGRSASYERVRDWWGAELPTAKGQYNFDEIRYVYYTNVQQLPEFFKSDSYDFRLENVIANWMTLYNIPAVNDGRIVKQDFPSNTVGRMQGFGFNIRRPKFQDSRVRQAFNLVFDFEELNRSAFFGQYKRIASYFAGLDQFSATGLPQGEELAILNSIKDKVRPEVFTTPYANPVNGTDEARRGNLRTALGLLKEAGWEIRDRKLTNVKTGEAMTVEILLDDDNFTKIALPYVQNLKRIGIDASVRVVDDSQYTQRVNNRDFDMIVFGAGQSQSPGNEQRDFWSSAAADQPTSRNSIGIKDPAVDALIDRIVYAKDRADLVAATKALDRVLLSGNYVVPMWYSGVWHTLRWNRFGQPAVLPTQSPTGGFPTVWWYDQALAAKTGAPK